MRDNIILLEMNEINFQYVQRYIDNGFPLDNFKHCFNAFGYRTTTSEDSYEELEPWIQWPTVKTGLKLNEHGVFRLGDAVSLAGKQIWEILEKKQLKVAAISPINAFNACENSPFWIPDPWVTTKCSGKGYLKRLHYALKQAVNDNAQSKIELKSIVYLFENLIRSLSPRRGGEYLKLIGKLFLKYPGGRSIFADRLLCDIFLNEYIKHKPDFSTLFLNAGAHIQHHYFYNSGVYNGERRNPDWYIKKTFDPLLEVLKLYDTIIGDLLKLQGVRLLIVTGLSQVPCQNPIYYWRIKRHNEFLDKLGIRYYRVEPRMTRDFTVYFSNLTDVKNAYNIMSQFRNSDNKLFFETLDIRDDSIFATLTYSGSIDDDMTFSISDVTKDDFVFVALKNGEHNQKGYIIDTGLSAALGEIDASSIFNLIEDYFK